MYVCMYVCMYIYIYISTTMLPNVACQLGSRARVLAERRNLQRWSQPRATQLERLFALARAPGSTDPVDKLDLPCSIDPARCSFEPTTSDLSRF